MQTPGAAMVCPSSLLPIVVKLLKSAAVSSTSVRHVAAARPPGWPLKSAIAVTVSTSSYAAGTKLLKSIALFPAATTYVTPALTEPQIALCNASLLVLPQLPSSDPLPPRLMFATLMPRLGAFAVTQSMPQMIHDQKPLPWLLRTRTE